MISTQCQVVNRGTWKVEAMGIAIANSANACACIWAVGLRLTPLVKPVGGIYFGVLIADVLVFSLYKKSCI